MNAKKIVLVLFAIAAGAAALAISFIALGVFLFSGLIMILVRRFPKQTEWARTSWYLIFIVGLGASVLVARSIKTHRPISCEYTIRGFLGTSTAKPQSKLESEPANPGIDVQHEIDRQGIELLQHGVVTKHWADVLDSARRTLESLTGDLSGDDSSKLTSAIDSLRASVDGLNSAEIQSRMDKLKNFIAEKREQAKNASDPSAFLEEFKRGKEDKNFSFEDPFTKIVTLQDLLYRFVHSKIKDLVTVSTPRLTAGLDKKKNTVVYSERVGIALAPNVSLQKIDFSELQLNAQLNGVTQSIAYSYDSAQPVEAKIAVIPVRAGVRTLTVVNQISTADRVEDACDTNRLLPFRRFYVRWPNAVRSFIGLHLNIENLGGHSVPYYFRLPLEKTSNIQEIEVPEYSFFNSNYTMKEESREMPGGISPDPPVSAATSAVSQPIEIELLPDSPIFRNSMVQKVKQYLFPLNAIVCFAYLALGSVFSLLVDPKK